jgi:hypothetical protein
MEMIRFRFAHADPSVHLEELDTLGNWRFVCAISLVDFLRMRHPGFAQAAEMDAIERRIRNEYTSEVKRQLAAEQGALCLAG